MDILMARAGNLGTYTTARVYDETCSQIAVMFDVDDRYLDITLIAVNEHVYNPHYGQTYAVYPSDKFDDVADAAVLQWEPFPDTVRTLGYFTTLEGAQRVLDILKANAVHAKPPREVRDEPDGIGFGWLPAFPFKAPCFRPE